MFLFLQDTSTHQDNLGSFSSRSDSSESELTSRSRLATHHCNTSSPCFFISKPVHPLSFPLQSPAREESSDFTASLDFDAATALHSDTTYRLSSGTSSSLDYTDMSELQFEAETSGSRPCSLLSSDVYKCGSCGRSLSQRSPWSSRRIVRTGDLPVSGVLPCHHVFHAECLEQISSKLQKHEPPCPVCTKLEEDQRLLNNRLGSGFPRLKPSPEDSPSKTWVCSQVGDCVEGALHASPRNSVILLNRNRLKKNLFVKGNLPGMVKRVSSSPK